MPNHPRTGKPPSGPVYEALRDFALGIERKKKIKKLKKKIKDLEKGG